MPFDYPGPSDELSRRELLGRSVADHHAAALAAAPAPAGWEVTLGPDLLFDAAGLALLTRALEAYDGSAQVLDIELELDEPTRRDYYSLQSPTTLTDTTLRLPVRATRGEGAAATLQVALPARSFPMPFPSSFLPEMDVTLPEGLLLPAHCPHDLLLASWIGLICDLEARARRSPAAWLRALVRRSWGATLGQRVALQTRSIHPTAEVHPTAVIEGAVIGPRARVGAYCTVRFSVVGADARLHDGAKVEMSVVGERSWLMHDLVLYRSVAEQDVFLIHGPYQFSYFQRGSAAFATIMMDWRPDDRPIRVATPAGLLPYGGPLLGSVLAEGAKTLGGALLAPGRVVPARVWLGPPAGSVHAPGSARLDTGRPLPPDESAARGQEPSGRRTEGST